ncbi:hypothetical protein E6P09_04515 [Haloferax mediterranei ATCC 33500]|uniref:Uncharacterized protein n=1 Tax=Haloferax mediterranei (strain ATCC 33500 / DSM 1411 / JCM 8866 / NBRC 14739 / NCIMB 2177 / R-4) TaxID=523841 RepID=I3R1B4_HALMT|nr:hypothetical protein [Haloferax mediterranei]AFK18024.1 hypothetical protein HFX_0285 [Haloferax mediterranei ATCC 33500]EMA02700.1 hypothetical protein C439_08955 [Haloferax mediterranei ATCC 33500]MDX5988116.1 hypothetical protein [Haloferax mediterranei ATCC 33500]QCQ74567.1 hypothetical protein E6P09_04515 [Haloferax mediterranei ATCC 33500]
MTERVPEFALLVGVFLGLSAAVSGAVLTGELFRPILTGVVVCYPFAAFGVVRSDDPSEALPPRFVTALGTVLGVVTLLTALLERPGDVLSGLVASLVVALPPAAYATRFGADVNPLSPVQTFVVTTAVGARFSPLRHSSALSVPSSVCWLGSRARSTPTLVACVPPTASAVSVSLPGYSPASQSRGSPS